MKQTLLCLTLLLVVNAARGHDIHPLTSASSFFSQLLFQKIALNETTLYCLPEYRIISLNFILVPPTTPLLVKYTEALKVFFYTGVGKYDYVAVGGPERPINEFVERKTLGYIPGLLPSGFITPETSVTGISVFYLNATWKVPFDPSKTRKHEFINVCEVGAQVELMNDIRYANVRTNVLGSTVLELPFAGDRISFYAVLPDQLEGLSSLEGSLTNPNNFNQLFTELKSCYTKISIPRFKVLSKFSLRQPLEQLGITRVFSQREAELRGISENRLHVSQLVHSLFFEITEAGTIPVAPAPAPQPGPLNQQNPQVTFNADRPFLFFVRDKVSLQILVQGKFSG
ncbi:unnamed protein product [Candidula unifasciata]|uniref:Serpin domain-containing protein n=1 Tax=Candidula unifasciata TaxID=100452 RepID=A0A8S3ZL77_9EUPU|nr:unnamed protein product [Candidula unifasciata]